MTINEAIYSTLDGVNISTDDFPVRKRFVYQQLKDTRAELIKQELNINKLLNDGTMQTITCMKLERVDASECFDTPSGEYVLRSVEKLPEVVEFRSGLAVYPYLMNGVRVDPANKDTMTTRHRRRFKLPGSFGFILKNRRIVISGYDDIEELDVTVDGHFVDPEEVDKLNSENQEDCKDECKPIFERDFSCPAHLLRRTIEIARGICLRKLGIPSDNSNNSQFDPNVKSSQEPNNR